MSHWSLIKVNVWQFRFSLIILWTCIKLFNQVSMLFHCIFRNVHGSSQINEHMFFLDPLMKTLLSWKLLLQGPCIVMKIWMEHVTDLNLKHIKGALSGRSQFLASESPLKMIKNAFYFTLKALFVLKIFRFLSNFLVIPKNGLIRKIYYVTTWETDVWPSWRLSK